MGKLIVFVPTFDDAVKSQHFAAALAMLIREPGSLKIAQAGNPERYWYGVARSYMNWNLRDTLVRGKQYHEKPGALPRTRALATLLSRPCLAPFCRGLLGRTVFLHLFLAWPLPGVFLLHELEARERARVLRCCE